MGPPEYLIIVLSIIAYGWSWSLQGGRFPRTGLEMTVLSLSCCCSYLAVSADLSVLNNNSHTKNVFAESLGIISPMKLTIPMMHINSFLTAHVWMAKSNPLRREFVSKEYNLLNTRLTFTIYWAKVHSFLHIILVNLWLIPPPWRMFSVCLYVCKQETYLSDFHETWWP